MPTTVNTDEIRERIVGIALALVSLAVDRVMQKPEVQTAILARIEANVEETILASLAHVPLEEPDATGSA